jgi:serine/threonine protein kinase
MAYCLNPDCKQPQNPDSLKFCQTCGGSLVLRGMYQAIAPIGQGGMGRTFRAINLGKFNQLCVIKQFMPQLQGDNISAETLQKATELFNREAKRLYELGKHPQIPELIASFAEHEQLYLVQELIEGENLWQELQANGAFSVMAIEKLLVDLLPVLQFIHDRGVIHRDIKPENIIRRHSDRLPVLVDFGAAKVALNSTTTATVIGSLDYTAPEQLRGKPTFASDLYSLGVTCIQLLTNAAPTELFCDRRDAWIWRQFLPQSLSEQQEVTIGRVLDKMLCRAVSNRYQSAIAALVDLQVEAGTQTISSSSAASSVQSTPGISAPRSTTKSKQPSAGDRGKIVPASPSKISNINNPEQQSNQSIAKFPSSTAQPIKPISPPDRLPDLSRARVRKNQEAQQNYPVPAQLDRQLVPAYNQLQQLLEVQAWQDADSLTNAILLQLLDRPNIAQVSKTDITHLPCEDLLHLDRLWTSYSGDRFGFAIQLEIWQELGGLVAYNADNYWQFADTYLKFAPKVGWQVKQAWFLPPFKNPLTATFAEPQWRKYEDFIFSRQAPRGHLPSFCYGDGFRLLDSLFARLKFCD